MEFSVWGPVHPLDRFQGALYHLAQPLPREQGLAGTAGLLNAVSSQELEVQ